MRGSDLMAGGFALLLCFSVSLFSQSPETLSTDQIVDKAYPSVALVLAGRGPGQPANSLGAAVVVRPNGILLTAYHVIKDAYSLQVRFKSGEVFDQVQLLGVDTRRDVAAIRITAAALPVLPIAIAQPRRRRATPWLWSRTPHRCSGRLRPALFLHIALRMKFRERVTDIG